MKRFIAGFVCLAAAVSITPALGTPAAARTTAPKRPEEALKRQFTPKRGVKFTQVTRGDDNDTIARGSGVFQFDRSGVIASDITTKIPSANEKDPFATPHPIFSPVHTIWVRGTAYSSGYLYEGILDPGQKWVRVPKGSPVGFGNALLSYVNFADPAALRTLLAQSKSRRSPYKITTTLGRLQRLSPWFRTFGNVKSSVKKTKVSLTVHVAANGLPRRVVHSYKLLGKYPVSTEVRFTGWGTKVNVKAPHGASVADGKKYSPR